MREIHGLRDLTKLAVSEGDTQSVTVRDGIGPSGKTRVELTMSTSSYPAGLTPDEARWLAKQLEDAALRAESAEEDAP